VKRADINPGEVYAYQESKYGSADEVIFLTPLDKDHLYQSNRGRKPGDPYYTLDEHAKRPAKNYFYGSTGYLVAIGSNVVKATLEEAINGKPKDVTSSYRYTVLIQTTKVIGLYQEVMELRKAREQAAQDASEARAAANVAQSEKMLALDARLKALGVNALLVSGSSFYRDTEYYRKNYPPTGFRLNLEAAEALATLIEGLTEGEGR
jgi:hypothetical protein